MGLEFKFKLKTSLCGHRGQRLFCFFTNASPTIIQLEFPIPFGVRKDATLLFLHPSEKQSLGKYPKFKYVNHTPV